jgi:CBS domain-containing protein
METAGTKFRLIDLLADLCTEKDVFFRYVRIATDIMTMRLKALTLDNTVQDALTFMEENGCRHAPVMDGPPAAEGRQKPDFVGVLSQRDLFRQISPRCGTPAETEEDARALKKPLSQVVTRNPKCVPPDTPIADVIRAMIEVRVDMLPVVEDKRLVGVITAGDIVAAFVMLGKISRLCQDHEDKTRLIDLFADDTSYGGISLAFVAQNVGDIMTKKPACLAPKEPLGKAMELMQQGKFRHVPVTDSEGRVHGILSDRDVLLHLPPPGVQANRGDKAFREHLFEVDVGDPALRLRVEQVMQHKPVTVTPDGGLYEAAQKLYERHISCLPVVDEQKHLIGIATVTDLMRSMLATYRLMDRSEH